MFGPRIGICMGLAALVLGGCGSGGSSSAGGGEEKKLSLAVIPKGTTHEFWKAVHAGAKKAADELGVDIIWKGPQKENDLEQQIQVVEDFVAKGVDGIVLAPLDSKGLVGAVQDAVNGGVPVLIFDSDLDGGDTVSFVATDNFKGGQIAGDAMAKALGENGKVVVLRYAEGSASTHQREEGFLDAIKKFPGIEVVSSNQYAGPTTETAQKAGENLLAPFGKPDGSLSIDGIFCPNESSTFGMLRVLQENGWAGKVRFYGFDSSDKLIEGLKSGEIHGLVLQNPFNMGYLAVKTLVAKLRGESVEKRIDTGAALATKENMNEKEIADLLSPPRE